MTLVDIFQGLRSTDGERVVEGLERTMEETKGVRPGFSHTWLKPNPPPQAEPVEEYEIKNTLVQLFRLGEETEDLYHIFPPEYKMKTAKARLISKMKDALVDSFSSDPNLSEQGRIKNYIEQRGMSLIQKSVESQDLELGESRSTELNEIKRLAQILAKYTAGYGVLETLLSDERVEDIYVDAPVERNEVYVEIKSSKKIRKKCRTNINLSSKDMDSILSRFRIESGRPFSEAFPVLEADLSEYDTRVTAIGSPLSSDGIALALRRRSQISWTLPRLIKVGSMTPLAAGLISFLIDGRSTILVGGSRGAGKTTLLGAMMMEFPRSQRILTIEDTRELPSSEMQSVGYNVQSTMISSGTYKGDLEANDVLRVALRLGESAIVMGEVRGEEAKTLYEAMRAGTAGSAVMGTIHGNSSQSIYERVVHDIGISKESFSATDVVMIAGIVRPGGAQKQERRLIEISEFADDGFSELMGYDEGLEATDHLKRNSEKIGEIARSWGLTYNQAVQNIKLRAKIKEKMVKTAQRKDKDELLNPEWVTKANSKFWTLISKYGQEKDYTKVEKKWMEWFEKRVKYA
ncbi:MAG: type II/IV secretion system ATPase subunit [Candidatus Thermoplasmatota archaeon]